MANRVRPINNAEERLMQQDEYEHQVSQSHQQNQQYQYHQQQRYQQQQQFTQQQEYHFQQQQVSKAPLVNIPTYSTSQKQNSSFISNSTRDHSPTTTSSSNLHSNSTITAPNTATSHLSSVTTNATSSSTLSATLKPHSATTSTSSLQVPNTATTSNVGSDISSTPSDVSYTPSAEVVADHGDEVGIKVVLRVRPFNDREVKLKSKPSISTQKQHREVNLRRKFKEDKKFYFDDVFDEFSSQRDVYASTGKRVLDRFVLGFNCCIFAYGQTGSGKTWTMQGLKGNETKEGIMSRFVHELFAYVERERTRTDITIKASYLEIYNEQVYDLLNPNTEKTMIAYDIREDRMKGTHITNIIEKPIVFVNELNELLDEGSTRRTVGETKMNLESSRSHAILQIFLEQLDKGDEDGYTLRTNKISLVDLAGSERQSATEKSERQKEGSKINLSLSNLGNVINAIVKKSNFVPYRNSKLTRLLKDSIGGNSYTLLVVCVSPSDLNIEESLSSLYFADRAKQIRNRIKVIRGDPRLERIAELVENEKLLRARIAELENQLSLGNSNNYIMTRNLMNSTIQDNNQNSSSIGIGNNNNILLSTMTMNHHNLTNNTNNANINMVFETSTMTDIFGYEIDEAFDHYRTITAIEEPVTTASKLVQTEDNDQIMVNQIIQELDNNEIILQDGKHYQQEQYFGEQQGELVFDEMKEQEMIEQERREQDVLDQRRLEQEIIDQLDMIDDQPGVKHVEPNVMPYYNDNDRSYHQQQEYAHQHHPQHSKRYQQAHYDDGNYEDEHYIDQPYEYQDGNYHDPRYHSNHQQQQEQQYNQQHQYKEPYREEYYPPNHVNRTPRDELYNDNHRLAQQAKQNHRGNESDYYQDGDQSKCVIL